jgi:CheY-like chemotaxis protein
MARILLVDDNAELRGLLRLGLEEAGHQVAEAGEGTEALRLYKEAPADLVVCDLFMPGKEGLETIRELRQSGDVPIIAVSGDGPAGTGSLLRAALLLGAARALEKPFDLTTFLENVRAVLAEAAKERA